MEWKVGPRGFVHGWHFVGIPGTGDHVHHPSHGKGIVTAVTDKHVSVRFAGSGAERTFEHSKPRAGQATGFVKRGDHEAAKAGHDVPKPEKAHAPVASFSPGYLRGEGATDSDAAELARRYQVMHGKPPAAAEVAKIRRAKPGGKATTSMSRDDGLAKARSIHEADKAAGGGHLPPLALLGNDKHPDGSVSARAVDHEGRDYAVKLGADKTVTVTHKGKSLTEPAGSNPTQKARELAGKLTAPAPAEAKPEADDFWAHEQPKAPPAPPAPKPVFDQPGMFADTDRLGTAPMFGDQFGTSDITKPADGVAPVSTHAATARAIAAGVRSEPGLVRGQKDEAETRLYAAAKHLDAGNHAEAVRELDDTAHAAGLRGGGVIKGSTAAKARDLAAQVRVEHGIAPQAPDKPAGEPGRQALNEQLSAEMGKILPQLSQDGDITGEGPVARDAVAEARTHIDAGRTQQADEALAKAQRQITGLAGRNIADMRARIKFADAHGAEAATATDTPWHGSLANGDEAEYRRMGGHTLTMRRDSNGNVYRGHVNGTYLAGNEDLGKLRRSMNGRGGKMAPREEKASPALREVKDLAASITSISGREDAVRRHLADASTALEDGDIKTAYGALDMARRHALGEFGANPDRPVLLEDKTEAWRPIIRLRDSVRATVPRDA
jgi:hypothetical protein